jgi:cytochrome c-type biogenesis protein CcsB
MTTVFYGAVLMLYTAATLCYGFYLVRPADALGRWSCRILILGFLCHGLFTLDRFLRAGHLPITNLHESLSFFSLTLVGLLLVLQTRYRSPALGSFVMPLALLVMLSSALFPSAIVPLSPALESGWLGVHAVAAFAGYGAFAIAFCAGIMYLLQERSLKRKKRGALSRRLPPLETLDAINYRCLTTGSPLLTVAIITGALWAESAWGAYWRWDPKETWALVTWFVYAALLHGRLTTGWRGSRAALLAIVGFCVVLFTFLGVNFLLPGLHGAR